MQQPRRQWQWLRFQHQSPVGSWTGTGYEPTTTINIRADHTGNFVVGQSFTRQLSGDHLYLVLDTSKDNEDFLFK